MKIFGRRIIKQVTLERVASMVKNGNSEDRDIASELLIGSRKPSEPQFRVLITRDKISLCERRDGNWVNIDSSYGDFTAEDHRNHYIQKFKKRIEGAAKPFENITLYY